MTAAMLQSTLAKLDEAQGDAFERELRDVFKPVDRSDIVEWQERNIESVPYSPRQGRLSFEESPWLIAPSQAIGDRDTRRIQVRAPIQTGKSLLIEAASCHFIARAPGPTLFLSDTDDNADDWAITRLHKLWQNCPPVRKRLPNGRPGKADFTDFAHMPFWTMGANTKRNLQRRSILNLAMDETWLYPHGHIKEALARVDAFAASAKVIQASQGSFAGDETDKCWEESTQEAYGFRCPCCEKEQAWDFANLVFPDDAKTDGGEWNYRALVAGTRLRCANDECKAMFDDKPSVRRMLNARWCYIPQNTGGDPTFRGFTWDAICAKSWGKQAERFARAQVALQVDGDDKLMQQVVQKDRARSWKPIVCAEDTTVATASEYKNGDAWEDEAWVADGRRLVLAGDAGAICPLRVVTIDHQRNGFWALCRSWAADGRSRLRGFEFLRTWEDISLFVSRHGVHNTLVFHDCGDAGTEFWKRLMVGKWQALRGDRRDEFPWEVPDPADRSKTITVMKPYGKGTFGESRNYRVPVFYYSNLICKDRLAHLRIQGVHTVGIDTPAEYAEQMASEKRTPGKKPVWVQVGNRPNHLWDTEVMQLVPLFSLGVFKVKQQKEGEQAESGTLS